MLFAPKLSKTEAIKSMMWTRENKITFGDVFVRWHKNAK